MIAESSPNGSLLAANNLRDLTSLPNAWTNLSVESKDDLGTLRSTLRPRGGVAFDGTAATRLSVILTGQNIGTDDFSVVMVRRIPSAQSASEQDLLGLTGSLSGIAPPELVASIPANTDTLRVAFRTATGDRRAEVASFRSTYSGQVVMLAFVRAAGVFTIYANAATQSYNVATAGATPPSDFSSSITSTYLVLGANTARTPLATAAYSATLYNCALSAADVQEIYELGGGVPERYKFGSQAELFSNGGFETLGGGGADVFASWAESRTGSSTITQDTVEFYAGAASCKIFIDSSNSAAEIGQSVAAQNRAYRLRFYAKADIVSSDLIKIDAANYAIILGTQIALTTSWQAFTFEFTAPDSTVKFRRGNANSRTVWIDSASLVRIGAVVHLPLNDGIGYQLHDESTNKLDATMTTTGVSHINPRRHGYVRDTLTWAGTHEQKGLLAAQRCFPNGAIIKRVSLKATAANTGSGATLGVTGAALHYTGGSYVTYTTAKKVLTAAQLAAVIPPGTTDNNCTFSIDPDTNNYTGSIQVDVSYAVTEGTP